jgi:predicted ATPase
MWVISMTITDDTIDEDVQKLATECLKQMKEKNCIAPAFLVALIAEARASEQDKAKAIQILAFEQGLAEGYNKGQADLIGKVRKCYLISADLEERPLSYVYREELEQIFREASKSAGEVATVPSTRRTQQINAPENACKHSWHIGKPEYCEKCGLYKETKPENAKKVEK